MDKQDRRWVRGANTALFFSGLSASSGSIVLALLRQRYGLSYDFAGLLLALISVGNMAAGFLAGLLPALVGMRASALLLTAGGSVGYLLLASTGHPAALLLAFALIGAAKGGSINNGTVLVNHASPGRASSMNLMHAFFATGSLLCPLFIDLFSGGGMPWYAPMAALAACGAGNWLSFACIGLPKQQLAERTAGGSWGFLRSRLFWLVTGLIFFQNCTELTVTGWVVTYFQDTGILTGSLSNLTVTVVWGAMLAMRLLLGAVIRIRDNFKALAVMTIASMAAYLLLLSAKTGPAAIAALALFGLTIAGTNPTAVSSAGRLLSNSSVGVMLPVASLGAILMPSVVGAVAQKIGIWGGMLCVMAAMGGMLALSLLCRRELRRLQAAEKAGAAR